MSIQARDTGEVLSNYSRYKNILNEMENWPEQRSLAIQEKILNLPVLGSLLLRIAPHLSHLKVSLQSWGFRQLEKKSK